MVEISDAFVQLKPICNPQETESISNTALLVCIIVGSIVAFLALAFAVVMYLRAQSRKQEEQPTVAEETVEPADSAMEEGLNSVVENQEEQPSVAEEKVEPSESAIEEGLNSVVENQEEQPSVAVEEVEPTESAIENVE